MTRDQIAQMQARYDINDLELARLLGYQAGDKAARCGVRQMLKGRGLENVRVQRLLYYIERYRFPKEWLQTEKE